MTTEIEAGWALNDAIIDALRATNDEPDPERLWKAVQAFQAAAPERSRVSPKTLEDPREALREAFKTYYRSLVADLDEHADDADAVRDTELSMAEVRAAGRALFFDHLDR